MNSFCTYFDKNFLPQGISLIRSIASVCKEKYILYVLCLDETTYEVLKKLNFKNVELLQETNLHQFNPRLAEIKTERPLTEYFYCFTPILISKILSENVEISFTIYIDADIFFFRDFLPFVNEYREADILLFEHGTPITQSRMESGVYNVGFNFFRNTENSKAALQWWTERNFESTGRGNGVWGDQKYLEGIPKLFQKVAAVKSLHAIAAPWNIMLGDFSMIEGCPSINGTPLIMYHYARLLVVNEKIFVPIKRTKLSKDVLNYIYTPYMKSLSEAIISIKTVLPGFRVRYTRKNWNGLILSLVTGRGFSYKDNKISRIGINIPFGYK